MEYTHEMNLLSDSGYCMPFDGIDEEVVLTKGYGPQEDGSFNHGIDLATQSYVLKAVADGIVTAIGTTPAHGLYQTIRYGNYEVTYGHIRNAMVSFGSRVKASAPVAVSGKTLHIEVRYDGSEVNPIDFLTMLYGNVKMHEAGSTGGFPDFETVALDVPTDYDEHSEEIEDLLMRFYSEYLMEVSSGLYTVPLRTEQSLRNIFSMAAVRKYFYEKIPSMANPLGVAERAIPIAAKVHNLLIADFLNYLALRHQVYLSALDDNDKKKATTGQ